MVLSPNKLKQLKAFHGAIQEKLLTPSDSFYVPELNATATDDPILAMRQEIYFQEGGGVCLFTGQRGTGKSTELKRLEQLLETDGCMVFYVDISAFMILSKEVEISDFLISICGGLSEAIAVRCEQNPADRSYWERLRTFMNSKVEFKEISTSLAGVDLKASLATDPMFKQRIQQGLRGHVTALIQDAHAFLKEAVEFVRTWKKDPACKVVLILDSVERIRGVGDDAMKVYDSVRNLFFSFGESLRIPMLHMVYTVPPYLSIIASGAGMTLGGATTYRLVTTHIFKDRSRDIDAGGLALLRKVVSKRYAAWKMVFQPAALDQLAVSSGGDLREFFRLIRFCLAAVKNDSDLPLSTDSVKKAENEGRREFLPLPDDHLAWLKRISVSKNIELDDETRLPTLAHFLDVRLVLNYKNGSDWYDIHPLLREVVDAYVPANTGA